MSVNPQHSASGAVADAERLWFGHPRGLATLFFTEMWERFSYYGMRGLLVLFMTTPLAAGNAGLGLDTKDATAIYGLYTAMVYLVSLPGGWVADKVLGLRASVFWGGVVIAVVVGEVAAGDIEADAMAGEEGDRGGVQADFVAHDFAGRDQIGFGADAVAIAGADLALGDIDGFSVGVDVAV